MAVFAEDAAMVLEEIAENGELCKFTLPPTKIDTAQPWKDAVVSADPTTLPVLAFAAVMFLPVGRIGYETLVALVGTEVPKGFELGYMGSFFEPSLKHLCERGNGVIYAVRNVIPLNPNGELILQTVLFQRQ